MGVYERPMKPVLVRRIMIDAGHSVEVISDGAEFHYYPAFENTRGAWQRYRTKAGEISFLDEWEARSFFVNNHLI